MNILLTGGAGYIGSHTYLALQEAGFRPVILDNFSNSRPTVLARLGRISGYPVLCETGNLDDTSWVKSVLNRYAIKGVVHFAGYKAVGESWDAPLKYYTNNIGGTLSLLNAMNEVGCRTLVFSSSAAVYGEPTTVPVNESHPLSYVNPYGHTKLTCEEMLGSLCTSSAAWKVGILRYFNPAGAHPSGLIGECANDKPNNLMPQVAEVAVGLRPFVTVYGGDYNTPDGTGVRDYVHVQDLARGHVSALQYLLDSGQSFTVNLGTGEGSSVLDVICAFESASGRAVPYVIAPRRAGDTAQCYADVSLAHTLLGWSATHTLADMCSDSWRWQQQNPNGYAI